MISLKINSDIFFGSNWNNVLVLFCHSLNLKWPCQTLSDMCDTISSLIFNSQKLSAHAAHWWIHFLVRGDWTPWNSIPSCRQVKVSHSLESVLFSLECLSPWEGIIPDMCSVLFSLSLERARHDSFDVTTWHLLSCLHIWIILRNTIASQEKGISIIYLFMYVLSV